MKAAPKKSLTKAQITKLEKRFAAWKFSADYAKASRTLLFTKHIDALVFIARISVHVEVQQTYPEIVFTKAKIKITIAGESILTDANLAFMERVDVSYQTARG